MRRVNDATRCGGELVGRNFWYPLCYSHSGFGHSDLPIMGETRSARPEEEARSVRAWQFTGTHEPLVLVDVPEPRQGPDEVLVDIKACGLCHSDVGVLEVDDFPFPARASLPVTLGHEVAGVISQVGANVDDWSVGDRVGIGNVGDAIPGLMRDGGYTQMIASASDVLVRIPDDVSFEQAAFAMDAGMSAYGSVITVGHVSAGDKVGIIGLGGLGQIGARVAHLAGCEVHVAEIREELWPLAHELGATSTVKDVEELADQELNVIIDFAGVGTTTEGAIRAVADGGRVIQVGMTATEATIDTFQLIMKRVTLAGSLGGTLDDVRSVFDLIASGELNPRTTIIGFDEIPRGLERISKGEVVGRLVATVAV